MKKDLVILLIILLIGITSPFLFPNFVVNLSVVWLFILFSLTWDVQGGQMGYNSFGNIVFYGLGMYTCALVQVGLFFSIGEWTEAGGEKTFLHTIPQYFTGLGVGLIFSSIIPVLSAIIIGLGLLRVRGQYFAIGTLGLGIAAGEIASGIEVIGGGQGMTVPIWPRAAGTTDLRNLVFYYLSFASFLGTFLFLRWLYQTRFGLTLNAIRDDEDKAEAMGIPTMRYKIIGWCISAFFLGISGALMGNMNGYIDPIDGAFTGPTVGLWMIIMALLGGKGTLWGPIIGAVLFYFFKEFFWMKFLGWQYVALGLLVVVVVVFFPEGLMGWLKRKFPEKFGEVVDKERASGIHLD